MYRNAVNGLKSVNDFDSLLIYLRDELDWPVDDYGFDDLTFQCTATELGLDEQSAAKVTEIRRLRPLNDEQPWGIFFLELEPKRLPVVALRRLLFKMTLKKRDAFNRSDSPAWHADDILFISRTGESNERHLTFAHFAANPEKADLPVLKMLGWDASDTVLRLDHVAEVLKEKLVWPENPSDPDQWRKQWRDAFTLRHREQITTAKEMASRLAEMARGIRGAIREVLAVEGESGPLTRIMDAFRESLVHDLDSEQFADTYAQTITYGLLSARITDPTKNTLDDLALHMQTNPFLKELMESFFHVGGRKISEKGVGLDFDELGVSNVIELLDDANMKAVVRDFGRNNQQADPVIHFFEGFLQEYDSSIRKDRGVFYTPRPVVSFIVRSVDELLRTEFGLEDGLADNATWGEMAARIDDLEIPEGATAEQNFVQILDPATGTGTFLVEVIDLVHKTMIAKWQSAGHGKMKIEELWNAYVPERLLPRLHGYELMMAPYAVAHMKIGLKLNETGYRFESEERARVYLTNALEPAQDFAGTPAFAIPALAHEAEAVNAIKRDQRFTVVIGNPPYSKVSSNMDEWIDGLLKFNQSTPVKCQSYYEVDGAPLRERKLWLQDDYVKFIRLGQFCIGMSSCGILAYITNNGYLGNPTFNGMRQSLSASFPDIFILNLHGDSNVGETPPDGLSNENVFDIQQGISISIFHRIRSTQRRGVSYRDLWGTRDEKYSFLTTECAGAEHPETLHLSSPLYLLLPIDESVRIEFEAGMLLTEVMGYSTSGIVTSRDSLVIGSNDDEIGEKIAVFLDESRSDEEVMQELDLSENYAWRVGEARRKLRSDSNWKNQFVSVLYRPFDVRRILYHPAVVWRTREKKMSVMLSGDNIGLLATRQTTTDFSHVWCSRHLIEMKACSHDRNTEIFPLLVGEPSEKTLGAVGEWDRANITPQFLRRLEEAIGMPRGDSRKKLQPIDILHFIISILHSPLYRVRFKDQLRRSYPRVLLPNGKTLFDQLRQCGAKLVSLALTESEILNTPITTLETTGDFTVEKVSYSDETVWIDKAKMRGFKGVPKEVWNFHIGGYRVCEKWLKDRGPKKGNLGRVLTDEDIAQYQKIVVALGKVICIMAEIDEVIEVHGGWSGAFQKGDAGDEPVGDVVYAEVDDGATQLDMVAEPKDG